MLPLHPLPVRAVGCSQPWWFMWYGFGVAGELSNFTPGEYIRWTWAGERGRRSRWLCKYIIKVILHREERKGRKVKVTMSLRSLRPLRWVLFMLKLDFSCTSPAASLCA
ncbi:MAG: hypothetical protein GQ469_01250 [Methanosarcinales archaeon]|nr:hypothetical protein [Methanosarcinales archaeon]